MVTINDHFTKRLFDPWQYLQPRRRRLLEHSWAGLFRTHLFEKIPVGTIAKRFHPEHGRPTKELYTVIGALALQQMHNLSDGAVVEALAFNTQWHYALDIIGESDHEKYLCAKTLRTYRNMLVEAHLDVVLFETMTDALLTHFDSDTSKQRLDSGHICSNMRKLRRVDILTQTIAKFLKQLQKTHKELLDGLVAPEFHARYLDKESRGCFSKVKPTDASQALQQAAEDLYSLVELFCANTAVHHWHTYRLLQRVFSDQCHVTGTETEPTVAIKPPQKIPADSLQNPSDPDATYDGHKGQGYQVQIMETYHPHADDEPSDKTTPNFITYVNVEQAHEADEHALEPAIENTQARGCAPDEVQCDASYGSDDNVQQAKNEGVDVIAPVKGPANAPATHLKDFTFEDATHFVQHCPEGHPPKAVTRTKKNTLTARFSKVHCCACPRRATCPVKVRTRDAYLRYDEKQFRLARRRAYEQTPEFLDKYRWRAGIEGTISHVKMDTGANRLRIRGLPQVRFAVTLKALGVNMFRAAKANAAALWALFMRLWGYKKLHATTQAKLLTFCPGSRLFYNQLSKNNGVDATA